MPVADPQRLVLIVELRVRLLRVPRLDQGRRIVNPHVDLDQPRIHFLPDLDRFDLVRIVGIAPLIDSRLQLIGMDDQLVAIPEADGIAVIERKPILLRDVTAAIGVDTADVVHHLVDQIGLIRCDDEVAEERLGQPARVARRRAGRDRIPLDSFVGHLDTLGELPLKFRRQLRRWRGAALLIRVKGDSAAGARIHTRPVGHRRGRQAPAAVRALLEREVQRFRGLVRLSELDHPLAGLRGILRANGVHQQRRSDK